MQTFFSKGAEDAGSGGEAERLDKTPAPGPGSADKWRRKGEKLLEQKRYADAALALSRAVDLNPRVAAIHYHLGIALAGCGRQQEAKEAYTRALSLKPDYPEALNNLGALLESQGGLSEAAVCFERAVKIDPRFTTAINNLGLVRFKLGHLDDAAVQFRRLLALQPNLPETLNNLGMVLYLQNALEESEACFRRAVALRPRYPEALYHLGIVLEGCGRQQEAVEAYRQALSLKPAYLEVLNNLGSILKEQGEPVEARSCFEAALKVAPNSTVVINNLGLVHYSLGNLDEAAMFYRKALALQPDFPEALSNLGQVLRLQNSVEESLVRCRRALALRPDYPEALMNLGSSLYDSGRLPEAISCLERAVSLKNDSPGLHLDLGMLLLAAGRLEEGWREYEWRWERPDLAAVRRPYEQPRWTGEAAENRVLLLWPEQGFGDTLQFCRYAPLAAARGLRVVLMVQPALVRLMRSLPGVDEIISSGQALPPHDFQCPLMSLPLAFGTQLESIPADISYLSPAKEDVLAWRERLPDNPSGCLRVGLVWAGNTWRHVPHIAALDRRRSILPEMLAPILDVRGVQFYSLQKDGTSAPAEFGLIDLMDECRDFADTAALVANLDLVISVDTAVAHLVGAIGKPVWVLSRFASCWRWLHGREDSPWYPTLRLFRQPRSGDWESVLARVRSELEQLADGG